MMLNSYCREILYITNLNLTNIIIIKIVAISIDLMLIGSMFPVDNEC